MHACACVAVCMCDKGRGGIVYGLEEGFSSMRCNKFDAGISGFEDRASGIS